jgi:NAD(P)-dependent dehydrogenase (short-subunit alcohol dehydrogenase family)
VAELAARGARKIYAGVRSPGDVTDQFKDLPVEVVSLDVTDLTLVQAAAVGCPDVNLLVNNAGLFTNRRLVLTDDPDAARREMEVNYFGVLNMTRAFAPVLGANGGGYIAPSQVRPGSGPVRARDGQAAQGHRHGHRPVAAGAEIIGLHVTDREHGVGLARELCHTLIRFV